MKKIMYVSGGMLIFILVLFFWNTYTQKSTDTRIPVSATFYPVAFLAEQIGGDLVHVQTVVPPGVEPHDFDPSLRDIADMYRSKLILINGAGVDRWAEKLEDAFLAQGGTVVVLARSVDLLPVAGAGDEATNTAGESDPHFWLDPISYEKSALAVLQGLIQSDPSHAVIYRANFDRFERTLGVIDTQFQELASPACHLHTVAVSHNAFTYMAKRYGFSVHSLAGASPEQEVSIGELTDVVRFMQVQHIPYVLDEPLGNREVATTIGREAGAEVLLLNPIEGLFPEHIRAGKNYFTVMNENWITLRKALECE